MSLVTRLLGALMLTYAAVYTAQYIFSAFYDGAAQVWSVLNVVSAVMVLVALAVNLMRVRLGVITYVYRVTLRLSDSEERGTWPRVLLYANGALAIWFFHNWVRLLLLQEGESVSVQHDVVWQLIAVMMPLVLIATGHWLWDVGDAVLDWRAARVSPEATPVTMFWTYVDLPTRTARVHREDCRYVIGRRTETLDNMWWTGPLESVEEAEAAGTMPRVAAVERCRICRPVP